MEVLKNGNIISGSLDTTLKIWDASTSQVLNVFDGHTHMVTKVVELSNGNLASASLDKSINIWERHSGEIVNTLEGFDDNIVDL
jgi:WD40 repeat protein